MVQFVELWGITMVVNAFMAGAGGANATEAIAGIMLGPLLYIMMLGSYIFGANR
jgi:hypothetical protein